MALPKGQLGKQNKLLPSIENKTRASYVDPEIIKRKKKAMRIIEDQLERNHNDFINDYNNNIPLEAILIAPENFFDNYMDIAMKLTSEIQGRISTTEYAGLVSEVRRNPVIGTKDEVLRAINKQFLQIETTPTGIDYNRLNKYEKRLVKILVFNEMIGLGPIEPMFRDLDIKEIAMNGPFRVDIEGEDGMIRVPSIKFKNRDHLNDLIARLYNSVNRTVSDTNPREHARLYDNSRVHVIHHTIAPDGPNVNIRRHPNDWVSPAQTVSWGSASKELMAYLAHAVYNGLSVLVVGSTGSGKTTLLSALTGYIPNHNRVVSIEKNIELKVCPSKLSAAPMEAISKKPGSDFPGVTMRDLVEASTQMRPDTIIVGEIVGDEAYDALTAANSGHQVLTTIHANSDFDSMYRLVQLTSQTNLITGKGVFDLIASSIDLVVVVERFQEDNSRKITSVSEVATHTAINEENGELYLPVHKIWEFVVDEESQKEGRITGTWEKVGELSKERQYKHRIDMQDIEPFEEYNQLFLSQEF